MGQVLGKWYYEVGQVFQSEVIFLQSGAIVTKRGNFYYKLEQLEQSKAIITKKGIITKQSNYYK